MRTQLLLSIRDHHKTVPYYGGERPEGSINHGFKLLKGNLVDVAQIPEAQGNEALLHALLVLNGPKSPFFTIGCEKACNKGDVGHWMKGYLEFSFNSIQLVADAQNYFALFYKFNECIQEREKQNMSTDPVEYHFDLEAAQFLATNTVGFTLTVWITTSFFPEEEGAKRAWGEAVDILVNYLKTLQIGPSAPIYSS